MSSPLPSDPRADRRDARGDAAAWTSRSPNGVVACAHYRAADAGAEVLAAGGNAADAAVAAALALNVCEPAGSGLGGMAMALVHGLPDRARPERGPGPWFVDGACRAPAAATPELVAASHRYRGARAVAVPGAPAALHTLHARFGRLPLADVVAPALALARSGSAVTPLQHRLAGTYRGALVGTDAAPLALDESGTPLPIGSVVSRPALQRTLSRIADAGLMDCYDGELGAALADDIAARDGFVRREDLAAFAAPEPRAPLSVPFAGRMLHTVGPPAGGLALAQLAGFVEALGRVPDPRDADDLVCIAELIRRARADRRRWGRRGGAEELGEAAVLLTPAFCRDALAKLDLGRPSGGETSHLCALDGDGGSVALTASVERSFGSCCAPPALGYVLNGYLRGFKVQNRRHPHFLRPGAPARSNAAPTLLTSRDDPAAPASLAIGSTGSERMVSGIFTTLLRLEREEPFAAVAGPRVHATPERVLLVERDRLPAGAVERLAARFELEDAGPWSFTFGGLQLALRDGADCVGVGEPRRDGGASSPRERAP